MSNIIESVRAFILQCPLLANEQVNVNYIGKNMAFSVDPLPCIPIIQRYVDGGSKKQYRFALTSKELYDEDTRINIENSQFYEDFEQWLEQQSFKGLDLDLGPKRSAVRFETATSAYLYDVDDAYARYMIECRLIYTQEV